MMKMVETLNEETGELSMLEAGGRQVEVTAQQLEMAAAGMGRFEGVRKALVLEERQRVDAEQLRVRLEFCGNLALAVSMEGPGQMTLKQAVALHEMLGRAIRSAKLVDA